MRNVSIYTIAELLGHSSIKMSMRYAHLSQGHKHDAVSLLNGICSDAQKKIIVGNIYSAAQLCHILFLTIMKVL